MSNQSFCEQIQGAVCQTCPLRTIGEDYWQASVRSEEIAAPDDLVEKLKDVTFTGPNSPAARGDDALLSAVLTLDREVVSLRGPEERKGIFWGRQGGGIVLKYFEGSQEVEVEEKSLPLEGQAILGCLRENFQNQCLESTAPDSMIPAGALGEDMAFATLEVIARHGSDEEVRNLIRTIAEIGLENNSDFVKSIARREVTVPILDTMSIARMREILLDSAQDEREED